MINPDLHLHTNRSDGVLSPELMAYECRQAGLTLMAVTDHDTFQGSDELMREDTGIPLIPGVELSLKDFSSLHLLCYGIAEGRPLRQKVSELAEKRRERAAKMLEKLSALGCPLSEQELRERCHGTIGRPHIARAMVHRGYVSSMSEAFNRYLGHNRPAYVAGERLGMAEALALVNEAGFVPVLAHPYELRLPQEQLFPLIQRWQAQGLKGIEVYHPSALSHGFDALDRFARANGLLVTGGSDFHQENDRHGKIGSMAAHWREAESDIQALMKALRKAAEGK